jgi:hypothetical protein
LRYGRNEDRQRQIVKLCNLYGVNQRNNQTTKINNKEKMNWFKRNKKQQPNNEPKIAIKHIYTDKSGTKWFEYENMLTIPAKRAIAAEIATRFADMNLTKSQLIRLFGEMKKNANEGNIVQLFHLMGEIEFRLNYIGEETTLLELASCYFLIEGEDETGFDEKHRQIKLDKFKTDSDCHDFFLQRAFEFTINYSNSSGTDILAFLKQTEPDNERLNQILRTLSLDDILTK